MSFLRAALGFTAAALVAAQQRAPPVWASAWSVNFSETTSIVVASYNTTGAWFYDFTNARERLDRATGKYDRYCGSVDGVDAPCSHLVSGGLRYLVWPTQSKCCGCCNSTQGCGIVTPTWMRDSNGTWAGTAPFSGPVWSGSADSWEITGLQPNYWFSEAGKDTPPVGFAQVPDDYMVSEEASARRRLRRQACSHAHAHPQHPHPFLPPSHSSLAVLRPGHIRRRPAARRALCAAVVLHADVPRHQHLHARLSGLFHSSFPKISV